MKGRLSVFFLAFGLLIMISPPLFAEDLTIRIDPQQTTVRISEVCSLDVVIENVTNLGAFQFDVVYSTDVVHADTALMGPFLSSTGRTVLPVGPDIDNTIVSGRLTFGGATFGADLGPDGSGVIATLVFIPQAADSSILELQNVQAADINGQALTIDSFVNGEIVVSSPTGMWIVTNTNDSGPGSLRWAIEQTNANAGPDSVVFNIPTTDLGYDSGTGVWTIRPDSALPALADESTIIDGTTQTANQGNTNPDGPEVEIDGTNAGEASGFTIYAANNMIKGLVVNRFTQFGIIITGLSANDNVVSGNYIGTDITGTTDMGNAFSGVIIYSGSRGNIIGGTTSAERNIISGNDWSGVEIQGLGADSNIGNYVGTDVTGCEDLGNSHYGVYIWSFAQGNTIGGTTDEERNIISGNDWAGIDIVHSDSNRVSGNYIGSGVGGTEDLGNAGNGIFIGNSAQGNIIGPNNLIINNGGSGVVVNGTEAISNTITQNSISNNDGLGIENTEGGNTELTPPTITVVTSTSVAGTAPPNSIVEIFSDSTDEGTVYEGAAVTDAVGNFTWTGTATGPFITATATDVGGNTSEFSVPVSSSDVEDQTQAKIPEAFELFQNYPNPFNPETQINFALPKFCHVTIAIYNVLGQEVRILVDRSLQVGHYVARWDGKDASGKWVSGGVYFVRMTADNFDVFKKAIFLK